MKTMVTVYLQGSSVESREYLAEYPLKAAQNAWETYGCILVENKGCAVYIYRSGCAIVEFEEVDDKHIKLFEDPNFINQIKTAIINEIDPGYIKIRKPLNPITMELSNDDVKPLPSIQDGVSELQIISKNMDNVKDQRTVELEKEVNALQSLLVDKEEKFEAEGQSKLGYIHNLQTIRNKQREEILKLREELAQCKCQFEEIGKQYIVENEDNFELLMVLKEAEDFIEDQKEKIEKLKADLEARTIIASGVVLMDDDEVKAFPGDHGILCYIEQVESTSSLELESIPVTPEHEMVTEPVEAEELAPGKYPAKKSKAGVKAKKVGPVNLEPPKEPEPVREMLPGRIMEQIRSMPEYATVTQFKDALCSYTDFGMYPVNILKLAYKETHKNLTW